MLLYLIITIPEPPLPLVPHHTPPPPPPVFTTPHCGPGAGLGPGCLEAPPVLVGSLGASDEGGAAPLPPPAYPVEEPEISLVVPVPPTLGPGQSLPAVAAPPPPAAPFPGPGESPPSFP